VRLPLVDIGARAMSLALRAHDDGEPRVEPAAATLVLRASTQRPRARTRSAPSMAASARTGA
jgi:hypothetical protein